MSNASHEARARLVADEPATLHEDATVPSRAAPVAASRARQARAERMRVRVYQVLVALIGLTAWQVLVNAKVLDIFFFSRPTDVAARMWQWIATGFIWKHMAATLLEALLSFVTGSAAGVLIGFLLARHDVAARVFEPYIRIFNALPRVILAPIFILWFGLGAGSKIALGFTLVFFVVFFNTFQGIREVDPVILSNARMLQATERDLVRHVYLPSAVSWIMASLHVSIGFALVGAVVGEYMGAARGMGYVVAQAEGVFDTTGVFAGLIMTSLVVLVVDAVIQSFERRMLRWRPQ